MITLPGTPQTTDPTTPGQPAQPTSTKKKSRKRPNADSKKGSPAAGDPGTGSGTVSTPKNRKKSESNQDEVLKARKFLDMNQGITSTTLPPMHSVSFSPIFSPI